MKFIVDAQLPPALAQFLRSLGHEASHVAELGLATADDAAVWSQACQSAAVIITKERTSKTASCSPTPAPA